MKAFKTTILLLLIAVGANAQNNPFKEFGYEPEYLTLSKGKYEEFHDMDTIVQIGHVWFNTVQNKVVGFVIKDTLFPEFASPEVVSRWLSPDPLASEFPGWTPYNYVEGNPILLIDPTGLYADDYSVDKSGNIKLEKETDDDFDQLFAKADYDKGDKSGGIKVNDQTILKDLSKTENVQVGIGVSRTIRKSTVGAGSQDDVFKVFEFASQNSMVEWSAVRGLKDGKEVYGIGSYNLGNLSPGGSRYGVNTDQMISLVHSHPNTRGSVQDEIGSLYGDRGVAWGLIQKSDNKRLGYNYYTYFPSSGRLWSIGKQYAQPNYIRNIQGNYKRFFFGTLNSK